MAVTPKQVEEGLNKEDEIVLESLQELIDNQLISNGYESQIFIGSPKNRIITKLITIYQDHGWQVAHYPAQDQRDEESLKFVPKRKMDASDYYSK